MSWRSGPHKNLAVGVFYRLWLGPHEYFIEKLNISKTDIRSGFVKRSKSPGHRGLCPRPSPGELTAALPILSSRWAGEHLLPKALGPSSFTLRPFSPPQALASPFPWTPQCCGRIGACVVNL